MSHVAYVGISGPAEPSHEEYDAALQIARWAAGQGHAVVCGGLGGVMEAAARGASEAGGVSLGLLPGADRTEANAYLTVAVPTGLGEVRNALIVRASDVLVCIGRSWGTLSELSLAIRTAVPVIGLGTWLPDDEEAAVAWERHGPGPRVVGSVAEATRAITEALRGR